MDTRVMRDPNSNITMKSAVLPAKELSSNLRQNRYLFWRVQENESITVDACKPLHLFTTGRRKTQVYYSIHASRRQQLGKNTNSGAIYTHLCQQEDQIITVFTIQIYKE